MGRLTTRDHPQSEIDKLKRRISDLETRNPLTNASTDGRIRFHGEAAILLQGNAQMEAGEYTLSPAGLMLPWNDGRFGLGTILNAVDGRARAAGDAASAAQGSANSAHNRIDTVNDLITTVNGRAVNAQNRADSAHNRIDTVNDLITTVNGRALDAQAAAATAQSRADSAYSLAEGRVTQTQRNVIVAKINQIIAVMATEGGNPKPPPIATG